MTTLILAGLVFTLFYLVGVLSVVLPALPGVPVVAVGALLAAWIGGFQTLTWTTVLIVAALAAFAWLLDYLAAVLGARAVRLEPGRAMGQHHRVYRRHLFSASGLYHRGARRRGGRRTFCRAALWQKRFGPASARSSGHSGGSSPRSLFWSVSPLSYTQSFFNVYTRAHLS